MVAEAPRRHAQLGSKRTRDRSALRVNDRFIKRRFPFEESNEVHLACIQDALAQCATVVEPACDSLTVSRGQHRVLCSNPAEHSALQPVMLTTASVDLYKRWIGVADETCRSHPEATRYWPLPLQPWSGRHVASREEFTVEERADIERAGWAYLFGDAALVADYRSVIELYHGEFEAAVYSVDDLSVMPGGRLTVLGAPAILLCRKLTLHAFGQLILYTACHAHLGSVRKFSSPHSLD